MAHKIVVNQFVVALLVYHVMMEYLHIEHIVVDEQELVDVVVDIEVFEHM